MTEQLNKDTGKLEAVDIDRQEIKSDDPTPNDVEQQADAKRTQFEVEQKGRQAKFERDQEAAARRQERDGELKAAEAAQRDKIAAADAENDQRAYEDGLLTDDDLRQHREYLAPHHDCVLPHQALALDEPSVKMAFPRTVILTRSVSDLHRTNKAMRERNAAVNPDERELIGSRGPALSPIVPSAPGTRVLFRKGYQDVPVSLADHDYLYANGAYRVNEDGKPESNEDRAARMTQEQRDEERADQLSSEGSDESSAQVRRPTERRPAV